MRMPLLPSQEWFFHEMHPQMISPSRWTIPRMFVLPAGVRASQVEQAVTHVWRHHPALRLHFTHDVGRWSQKVQPASTPPPVTHLHLGAAEAGDRGALASRISVDVSASMSIEGGRTVRFVHLDHGDDAPGRLLVVCHHLVIDGRSLDVVADDLRASLSAAMEDREPALRDAGAYEECVHAIHEYASTDLLGEIDHWMRQRDLDAAPARHEVRVPHGTVRTLQSDSVSSTVDAAGLAQFARTTLGSTLEPVAVAGLVEGLAGWTGSTTRIALMQHGRDIRGTRGSVLPRGATRTVGWFAGAGVLTVPHRDGRDALSYLADVAETISSVPNGGLGLALLRWSTPRRRRPAQIDELFDEATTLVNYVRRPAGSREPGLLTKAPEGVGSYVDLMEPRRVLGIGVGVGDSEVEMSFNFDPLRTSARTVRAVGERAAAAYAEYAWACA